MSGYGDKKLAKTQVSVTAEVPADRVSIASTRFRISSRKALIKRLLVILGCGASLLIFLLPSPTGLTLEGQRAIAVFVLSVTLWVTNVIPAPVTGLLSMALIPLLGALDTATAFRFFGSQAVFFILGALILAVGIQRTSLGDRMALALLSRFDRSGSALVGGVMLTGALLSFIMPEHAVAALLLPIVLQVAQKLGLRPHEGHLGRVLFLAMVWGIVAGGITTFLGGARNIFAVTLLEQTYGTSIGFFEWIAYAWPIPAITLVVAYSYLRLRYRLEAKDVGAVTRSLRREVESLDGWTGPEKRLAVILVVCVLMWMLAGQAVPLAVTALLGAVASLVFKVIRWSDVERDLNWGVLLMYGGAIVMASALAETGAVSWISDMIFEEIVVPPILFVLLAAILTMALSEVISNVAAVATMLPLTFSWGATLGMDPLLVTLVTALSGGLAFMLPIGTPPNAIAYSAGYYSIADSVRNGVVVSAVAVLTIILTAFVYWPALGVVW